MKHCQQEMTVIQNAWPVVCNFGWLIEADRNARKGKRYRAEVLNFTARLEDNLFTIQQGMMNGSYVLGPYRKLWGYVPQKRLGDGAGLPGQNCAMEPVPVFESDL